ncbi:transposase [Pseudomonas fluorescens]|uniref:transposase n=1 Tax=Pseudomonas fluorescens TaxID=294 RepID=UPI001CD62397|nr:transposase [Pseudomonas fluorescens]
MQPTRRSYSKSFKAQVIQECAQPGASIASIALSHSLKPLGQASRRGAITRPDLGVKLEHSEISLDGHADVFRCCCSCRFANQHCAGLFEVGR